MIHIPFSSSWRRFRKSSCLNWHCCESTFTRYGPYIVQVGKHFVLSSILLLEATSNKGIATRTGARTLLVAFVTTSRQSQILVSSSDLELSQTMRSIWVLPVYLRSIVPMSNIAVPATWSRLFVFANGLPGAVHLKPKEMEPLVASLLLVAMPFATGSEPCS